MTKQTKKVNSSEVKNWVMFVFALGLLYGMFRRGDELGPWWTLIIGAMLSLTTLVVAVENIMSLIKRGTNGNGSKPDPTGGGTSSGEGGSSGPQSDSNSANHRQSSASVAAEVASRWYGHLLGGRHHDPGTVQ